MKKRQKWVDLGIWNKNWSRNEIHGKHACLDRVTFFQKTKKLRFVHLELA
jgi:hypothetical protein